MAHTNEERELNQRDLDREKQDLFVTESNDARKSYFVPDEFFTESPLPIEPVKDENKHSLGFARLFNSYMHDIGKDPAFVMCRKCKEWVKTNYECCGV